MTLADTAVELTTANGSNPCTITVAWQMAVSHFLALVANDRSRFPPAAGMGTDATVAFHNSLPKSGL